MLPLDADFYQNPYQTLSNLRQQTSMMWDDATQLWYVFTHTQVDELLRHPKLGRDIDQAQAQPNPQLAPFTQLSKHSLFDKEPPDHTRLKQLVHKAFTPRRVRSLAGEIETMAHNLIDDLPRERFNLLDSFAVPLPVQVIGRLLGVPLADCDKLRHWSQAIVPMYELERTPEIERAAVAASAEFAAYLRDLRQRRLQSPQDDMITALAFAEQDGDKLTEAELIATCVLLLNAGHEASVNVVGNGLMALWQHPEQWAMVLRQPQTISTAVEEFMRYDAPLQLFKRYVLQDIEYNGHQLKRGQQIALLFGSANRDETVFANADQLDITRQPNPHVGFGAGIHYCLGAPLARLELGITLRVLFERLPSLRVVDDGEFRPNFVLRGLKSLWCEAT